MKQKLDNDQPQNDIETQVGVGISIGIGVGFALGLVLDNLAMGLALGAAIGTSLSGVNDLNKERKSTLPIIAIIMGVVLFIGTTAVALIVFSR